MVILTTLGSTGRIRILQTFVSLVQNSQKLEKALVAGQHFLGVQAYKSSSKIKIHRNILDGWIHALREIFSAHIGELNEWKQTKYN